MSAIRTANGWAMIQVKTTPPTPIEECLPWKPAEMGKAEADGGIRRGLRDDMRAHKSLNVRR